MSQSGNFRCFWRFFKILFECFFVLNVFKKRILDPLIIKIKKKKLFEELSTFKNQEQSEPIEVSFRKYTFLLVSAKVT